MSNRHTQPMDSTDFRATYAAIVGIDWAEEKHAVCLLDGARQVEQELEHTPEAIAAWAEGLRRQFDGRPVAVCIEQARGALIHALMQYEHLVLFPINPKQAASYRESVSVAGKKDDAFDARLLAFYLREHPDLVRPWKPDDALTRELGRLCEMRRNIVEFRKQAVQQLTAALKQYFPQVLDVVDALHDGMALELLHRWPTLKELQRASPVSLRNFFRKFCRRNDEKIDALIAEIRAFKPLTNDFAIIQPSAMFVELLVQQIKQYNVALERFDRKIAEDFAQHEDAAIFRSLPGAGAALAPRLCAAMGTDRNRFESANNVQSYVGIAPVTKRSGKSCHIHRRFACPKFLRQTFHEFADHARQWSSWSKAYYEAHRAKGKKHHATVRSLAFKWIRIIYRLWQNRSTYDEAHYLATLKKRRSPLATLHQTR